MVKHNSREKMKQYMKGVINGSQEQNNYIATSNVELSSNPRWVSNTQGSEKLQELIRIGYIGQDTYAERLRLLEKYEVGEPMPTSALSVESLKKQGLVGLYFKKGEEAYLVMSESPTGEKSIAGAGTYSHMEKLRDVLREKNPECRIWIEINPRRPQ